MIGTVAAITGHCTGHMGGVVAHRRAIRDGSPPGKVNVGIHPAAVPDTKIHITAAKVVGGVLHGIHIGAEADPVVVGSLGRGSFSDPLDNIFAGQRRDDLGIEAHGEAMEVGGLSFNHSVISGRELRHFIVCDIGEEAHVQADCPVVMGGVRANHPCLQDRSHPIFRLNRSNPADASQCVALQAWPGRHRSEPGVCRNVSQ